MLDQPTGSARNNTHARRRPHLDFQDHLADLEASGLLLRIDRPINKDTELHPLVRWQFLGGVPEDKRRAFLFTDVRDAKGRRYDIPVVVGALFWFVVALLAIYLIWYIIAKKLRKKATIASKSVDSN